MESGVVVLGGATLEEPVKEGQGMKANGSALICLADTQEEVMKIVESDLYTQSKVWDLSKVRKRSRVQVSARRIENICKGTWLRLASANCYAWSSCTESACLLQLKYLASPANVLADSDLPIQERNSKGAVVFT